MYTMVIIATLLVSIAVNIYFVAHRNLNNKNTAYQSNSHIVVTDWADLATGVSGDLEIEQGFLRMLHRQYDLFCRKHHDYGRNNISVGGLQGVTIRIGDKTSRLFNLLGISEGANTDAFVSPAVKGEALLDSFLDLGNYGPIAAMLIEGTWNRIRPEDVWCVYNPKAVCATCTHQCAHCEDANEQ